MGDARSSNQDALEKFKLNRRINPGESPRECELDVARNAAPRKRAFLTGGVFLRFFTLSGFRGIAWRGGVK